VRLWLAAERRIGVALAAGYCPAGGPPGDTPETLLSDRRTLEWVAATLRGLDRRVGEILDLYYEGGIGQREIGERFGISEGRVSQLRNQALALMRREAPDFVPPLPDGDVVKVPHRAAAYAPGG
jgi:RNA polymerase sigma factor (sigma-70 family)